MKNLKLKPLILALAGTLMIAQYAMATEMQPKLREEISTTPGRAITPADETLISSAADKVLHHIALSRKDIGKKDVEGAKMNLSKAETLMDMIRSVAPTTIVKDRMWTADNKLKYENVEEKAPAKVPIYADLGERDVVDAVNLKAAKPAKTESHATKSTDATEPETADVMLYYEELDLPLSLTRNLLATAQAELGKGRLAQADQALRSAQDSVDFVGIYLPEPLAAARVNLEQAHAHYGEGKLAEAKSDVTTAIAQLTQAEKSADSDSKADLGKLLEDAQALQGRIEQGKPALSNDIVDLWRRTEALADRALESTAVGWAKLLHESKARADLIEAKRYIAYADIDANVANDPGKARTDLAKAKQHLDLATTEAAGKTGVEAQVKNAQHTVDNLLAGKAKTDPDSMDKLRVMLKQVIGKV